MESNGREVLFLLMICISGGSYIGWKGYRCNGIDYRDRWKIEKGEIRLRDWII